MSRLAQILVALALTAGFFHTILSPDPTLGTIHDAAFRGHAARVTAYLAEGGDVDARAEKVPPDPAAPGPTLLMRAAQGGRREIVRTLLEAGADPHLRGSGSWTALHYALAFGQVAVAEDLLARGVTYEPIPAGSPQPLHVAAGMHAPEAVGLLLRLGADVNAAGEFDRSPLHQACPSDHGLPVARRLRDHGAARDAVDAQGRQPIHDAAREEAVEVLDWLLAWGADPAARDIHGQTPLHLAADNGAWRSVERLLAVGVDPSLTDRKGRTALDLAEAVTRSSRRKRMQRVLELLRAARPAGETP